MSGGVSGARRRNCFKFGTCVFITQTGTHQGHKYSTFASGQQKQIRSDSEILLAQISVCLRFLAGVRVFEAAEIQIRQQILNPCLLLASGLRDYEIKLDRRISAARESLQLFLFGN